jgi:2-dehydropantoate 2-reductase
MDIAIMGAGAVGCYYGAMLALSGHAVTLIGRRKHVDAVNLNGLVLEKKGRLISIPMRASVEPNAVQQVQLILFCVKSTDTEAAVQVMKPHLSPDAVILSLQNGVDNAERLQAVLQQHAVIPVVVYVAAEMAGAGHVRHHGRGELVLGTSLASSQIARIFTEAGIPTDVAENASGPLWTKLILNCAYNALSAISQRPYGQLVERTEIKGVIKDVVQECQAVAQKMEQFIPDDIWSSVEQIAETMPTQYSSTAQDLARGKPSEIDYLNGYIVRKGSELGVATPVNRALHALVKLMETGRPEA